MLNRPALAAAAFFSIFSGAALADPLVTIDAGTPGDYVFPTSSLTGGGFSRLQHFYDNSMFGAYSGFGISILDVSFFRANEGFFNPLTIDMYLSTTTKTQATLTTSNLDLNLGADNTLFATMVSTGGPAPALLTFSNHINPFFYDGSVGNLLIDLRFRDIGGVLGSPATFQIDDAIGMASLSRTVLPVVNGVNRERALTARFQVDLDFSGPPPAVPEPSTWAMGGTALAGLLALSLRRRSV